MRTPQLWKRKDTEPKRNLNEVLLLTNVTRYHYAEPAREECSLVACIPAISDTGV